MESGEGGGRSSKRMRQFDEDEETTFTDIRLGPSVWKDGAPDSPQCPGERVKPESPASNFQPLPPWLWESQYLQSQPPQSMTTYWRSSSPPYFPKSTECLYSPEPPKYPPPDCAQLPNIPQQSPRMTPSLKSPESSYSPESPWNSYSPASPENSYSPKSPEYWYSPQPPESSYYYYPKTPEYSYSPKLPEYSYSPNSPAYPPSLPYRSEFPKVQLRQSPWQTSISLGESYSPESPKYWPTPQQSPDSYSPMSPICPDSPKYPPQYPFESPKYRPVAQQSPDSYLPPSPTCCSDSPQYQPNNSLESQATGMYSLPSPIYCPDSPQYQLNNSLESRPTVMCWLSTPIHYPDLSRYPPKHALESPKYGPTRPLSSFSQQSPHSFTFPSPLNCPGSRLLTGIEEPKTSKEREGSDSRAKRFD
ncbi:hypothetical protein SLEP1_g35853 [Rubroshorea leprosula]|uniref:Extensin-2-like n=1 Tax=Rubroshorea leprosula TaxID=152421 RepID=A0AAV5KPJ4_9ROSI|nr:hypothetical protein SLEP1_g35853 [Rubroshorea leprosula]